MVEAEVAVGMPLILKMAPEAAAAILARGGQLRAAKLANRVSYKRQVRMNIYIYICIYIHIHTYKHL